MYVCVCWNWCRTPDLTCDGAGINPKYSHIGRQFPANHHLVVENSKTILNLVFGKHLRTKKEMKRKIVIATCLTKNWYVVALWDTTPRDHWNSTLKRLIFVWDSLGNGVLTEKLGLTNSSFKIFVRDSLGNGVLTEKLGLTNSSFKVFWN